MNRKKHRHPSYKKGCATTPYALINFAVFYRFKGWLTIMPFCRRWIRGEPACCPPRSPNPWRCRSSWTGTPCHFHDRFPFQKVRDCKVADQSWDAASTHVHARKIDKNRRKRLMTLPVLTGPRIWHFFDYLWLSSGVRTIVTLVKDRELSEPDTATLRCVLFSDFRRIRSEKQRKSPSRLDEFVDTQWRHIWGCQPIRISFMTISSLSSVILWRHLNFLWLSLYAP